MNHEIKTNNIKKLLNKSSSKLPTPTLEKLRQARELALQHQKAAQNSPVLAWIGHGNHADGQHAHARQRWASLLLLFALLFSSLAYWHSCSTDHDVSDIDIAILTDEDLPLHAYVE